MITNRARSYMRSRATAEMSYRCMAFRSVPGQHDNVSLIYTAGATQELFDEPQPCRVWEITGAAAVTLGETEIMTQNVQLSLPWDAPLLKKNDEIEIVTSSAGDSSLLGKRFEILSSARAGEYRSTRRYTVKGVER